MRLENRLDGFPMKHSPQKDTVPWFVSNTKTLNSIISQPIKNDNTVLQYPWLSFCPLGSLWNETKLAAADNISNDFFFYSNGGQPTMRKVDVLINFILISRNHWGQKHGSFISGSGICRPKLKLHWSVYPPVLLRLPLFLNWVLKKRYKTLQMSVKPISSCVWGTFLHLNV